MVKLKIHVAVWNDALAKVFSILIHQHHTYLRSLTHGLEENTRPQDHIYSNLSSLLCPAMRNWLVVDLKFPGHDPAKNSICKAKKHCARIPTTFEAHVLENFWEAKTEVWSQASTTPKPSLDHLRFYNNVYKPQLNSHLNMSFLKSYKTLCFRCQTWIVLTERNFAKSMHLPLHLGHLHLNQVFRSWAFCCHERLVSVGDPCAVQVQKQTWMTYSGCCFIHPSFSFHEGSLWCFLWQTCFQLVCWCFPYNLCNISNEALTGPKVQRF